MTLQGLALSRSTLDRAAERRADPALVARLLADPATAVLVLDGDRAAVEEGPDGPRLVLRPPQEALRIAGDAPTVAAYLGQDDAGVDHVLLAALRVEGAGEGLGDPGARWAGLREVGTTLDDTGAGLLTTGVALAHWHAVHPRCARCGEATDVVQGGWARQCPHCGAQHFPRTDPAVIMTVTDERGRLLLGRQATWPERRFSTLAGFVEPGESLEAAVRREVLEEAGVVVGAVEYRGNQPWPFPASLMLGFAAVATSTDVHVDGTELTEARWWTREEFEADVASGALLLPPAVSIARRLIEAWYGGPVADAGGVWR